MVRGDQHLLEDCGGCSDHVRLLGKSVEQWRPIFDAVVGHAQQADVRRGSDEALLQVLAKAVVDGQATMSEATPAATPTMEMPVMMPMNAWRRLARR